MGEMKLNGVSYWEGALWGHHFYDFLYIILFNNNYYFDCNTLRTLPNWLFSVRWGYHLKLTDEKTYIQISNLIENIYPEQKLANDLSGLTDKILFSKLKKDKKRISNLEIDFIFIKKIGKVLRKKVSIDEIIAEKNRQVLEY